MRNVSSDDGAPRARLDDRIGQAAATPPLAPASVAFTRFRSQLAALAGISLGADKEYFAQSRLASAMRQHGVADLAELTRLIEKNESEALRKAIVDAMTTNETSFFRDRAPFDAFRDTILPQLLQARAHVRRLRLWCAACSTGQEAYSLAMILENEARALQGWRVDILATDISAAAIETARAGSYSQFEVQRGLSTSHLLRYFQRHDGNWRVNEHLRARVAFHEFNLLADFGELGVFDVIFCRNVLMYFEPEIRTGVLSRLGGALADDGYLFLGGSETAQEKASHFMPAPQQSVFRRRAAARPNLRLA